MTILAVAQDHTNILWAVPNFAAANARSNPAYSTTAVHFDAAWVSNAILCNPNESAFTLDLKENHTEFWLHFDFYPSTTLVTAGNAFIEFWSSSQTLQMGLVENAAGVIYDLRKSTNGTSFAAAYAGTFTVTASPVVALDIHIKIHASLGEIHVYRGGSLVYTFTGNTSTNGDNAIRYIIFKGGRNNTDRYISQVVAADVNTVGWKIQQHTPGSGAQDLSEWSGAYTDVDDILSSGDDRIHTNVVDDEVSFPMSNVVAAAASLVPLAVVCSGKFYRESSTTPTALSLGFSFSGSYSGSPNISLGDGTIGEEVVTHTFYANPSNGSGWDFAAIDAAQIAVKAK